MATPTEQLGGVRYNEDHPPLQQEQIEDFTNCLEYVESRIYEMRWEANQGRLPLDRKAEDDYSYLLSLRNYYNRMLKTAEGGVMRGKIETEEVGLLPYWLGDSACS